MVTPSKINDLSWREMIRFQARTFFSSPGHMLKIHFAKKRMGKNIKHGCNSDRRNPPPCIWGHHYQLDDNLVGQLTTSRDIFASQNDGPSRPNSRTSRAPSMGSLVKILSLSNIFCGSNELLMQENAFFAAQEKARPLSYRKVDCSFGGGVGQGGLDRPLIQP